MSDTKHYSFNINAKKYKHLIDWIEKMREENAVNLSSLIRKLLEKEYKKQNNGQKKN